MSILDRLRGRPADELEAALRRRSRDPRADVLALGERLGGTDALVRQLRARNVHPRVIYTLLDVHRQARHGTQPVDDAARAVLKALRNDLRIRHRFAGLPAGGGLTGELAAALDAGIAGFDDDGRDPREATSAAWQRLHQVATARGAQGRPGDWPGDQIRRLLGALGLETMALSALMDVQQRAYQPVDEEFRGQARSALEWLRADLTGPVMP